MGAPKALMAVGASTLLGMTVEPFAALGTTVCVVTGFHATAIEPHAQAMRAAVVRNPAPWRGMASSVRTGIRRVGALSDAVFVHPVDCPGVKDTTLRMLLSALSAFPSAHAAKPTYRGRGGHPVLLDRTACSLMLSSKRHMTLHDLLTALGPAVLRVETDDPSVVLDLDTPDDASAWRPQP